MKYIIDMSDEYVMESALYGKELAIPLCVNANDKSFYLPTGLKLTPYTEHDRKAIEDEVWSLAKEIAYCMSFSACEDAGMLCDDDTYTTATGVLEKLSYQEAKAKYEAWKKQKDEIRVGDELKDDGNIRAVVLDIRDEDYMSYEVFTENGITDEWQRGIVVKTGRHFDEVEELLKKMRGES